MNKEMTDYVAANVDRQSRSIALAKRPKPIELSPEQLLDDYERSARDWNIELIQTTIANYDEAFKAEILNGAKLSAIDRIYKWCTANGQDPDWSLLETAALKALATTITRVVEVEVMALPSVSEFLETEYIIEYEEEDGDEF